MSKTISTAARNAAADAVVDLVDAGSGAGYIEIRTGAKPAGPDSAATGTLLATLPMSDPAFGAAAVGVATASAITNDSSADASGTAGHFRIYDSDDAGIVDGDAGLSGSGAELILDDVDIVAGGTVSISALTVTMPAS